MVMRVTDEQVAVAVDAEPAGPALAIIGCGPGRAEIHSVAIVDLDAGGEVHDVEMVRAVDGDGAGADQVAVLHAFAAPDTLRLRMLAGTARQHPQVGVSSNARTSEETRGGWTLSVLHLGPVCLASLQKPVLSGYQFGPADARGEQDPH